MTIIYCQNPDDLLDGLPRPLMEVGTTEQWRIDEFIRTTKCSVCGWTPENHPVSQSFDPITIFENDVTTTSVNAIDVPGLRVIPPPGLYSVAFTGTISVGIAGATRYAKLSIALNNEVLPASRIEVSGQRIAFSCVSRVIGDGVSPISAKWSMAPGSGIVSLLGPRTLTFTPTVI